MNWDINNTKLKYFKFQVFLKLLKSCNTEPTENHFYKHTQNISRQDYKHFFLNSSTRYCGSRSGSVLVPNLNWNVNFVTDDAVTNIGFNTTISYSKTDCHQVITLDENSSSGVITSPGYPKYYPKRTVCEWWIVVCRLMYNSCLHLCNLT